MGGITDEKVILGSCYGYIQEAAFFFLIRAIMIRGKGAVVAAYQEDCVELKAFAGMYGHELDTIIVVLGGVGLYLLHLLLQGVELGHEGGEIAIFSQFFAPCSDNRDKNLAYILAVPSFQ